ncbi:MAG: hypothetical protein IPK58_01810 [Acidobacteria bacterium]|nr:hypothetical protein [Acidobacteriota bacterium]
MKASKWLSFFSCNITPYAKCNSSFEDQLPDITLSHDYDLGVCLAPAVPAEAEMPVVVVSANSLRPSQSPIPPLTISLIVSGEAKRRSDVVNGLVVGHAKL